METIAVVLSVKPDLVAEFEAGFRAHELPIWNDFHARGVLVRASLSRMDISSQPRDSAIQYLILAVFADGDGHHLHDDDPRFVEWNKLADAYQIGGGMAFGGQTLIQVDG